MTAPTYDTAIIGAGILGAATAMHLARAGRKVIVLEAATASSGATGSSFSWLNAVAKEPESYHRLNAAGAAEYAALAAILGQDVRHGGGCLEIAEDDDAAAALVAKVSRLAARGYAARLVDGHEARALEPGLHLAATATVAYYPNDSWVDAPQVAAALLAQARAGGAEVREGAPVTGFHRNGQHVLVTDAGGEWVQARAIAVCAGIGTPALLHMLGLALPVERRPGLLAVTTAVPAGTLGRLVYAPGIHLRPDVSGGLRLGADDTDELAGDDATEHAAQAGGDILLHRAAALLGLPATVAVARTLTGIRPIPADGLTVAGALPGLDNAFVAVTHSGVTLGPLVGRLLAEEIQGAPPSALLRDFRPGRITGVTAG